MTWGARRWLVTAAACAVVSAALPAGAAVAAGGTVAGRVTDTLGVPLSDVCVRALPASYGGGAAVASTVTSTDGTYDLPTPAGRYYVAFADCGSRDLVTSYWRNAELRYSSTPVEVGDGQRVTGIDGRLAQGGAMSGRVTRTDGTPVPSVRVYLRKDTWGTTYPDDTYLVTDGQGRFTARGLPARAYRVSFGPAYDLAGVLYGDTADAAESPDVVVTAGEERTGVDARLPRVASVSGVVRDDEGAPHAGVCVTAVPALAPGSLSSGTVPTAADGTYTLSGLTAATHRIEFSDCGRVTASTWYPAATTFGTATPLVVGEGATVTGIDAVMSRGLTIKGTVRGTDGVPIKGVGVSVHDAATGSATGRYAFTDDQGRYTVVGLRGNRYTLHFYTAPTALELVPRWWPGVRTKAEAEAVSLTDGQSVSGVDITLRRGGRVLGNVGLPDGAPATGACVYAQSLLSEEGNAARVGADGSYVLRGLDHGDHRVWFTSCDNRTNYAPHFYGGTDEYESAAPVAVELESDTPGIDGILEPGGTLTGVVTDVTAQPIERICASARRPMRHLGQGGMAATDASGRFTITGLPPNDDYRVELTDCYRTPGRYVDTWNASARSSSTAPPITVRSGEESTTFAVMEVGGSLSGTVTDQFGLPLYGVCPWASTDGFGKGAHSTRSDGRYSIGGLRPGRYRVSLTDCGAGLVTRTHYYPGVTDHTKATYVEVRPDEDTSRLDVSVDVVTTPKAPRDVRVEPGDRAATVSWQPPADTGNAALTAFEVRDAAGALVTRTTAAARTATVTGLTNGTTYAFTVNAVNVKGAGDVSDAVDVRPRSPGRLSLAVPAVVESGSYADLTGRLTDASGTAVAGVTVSLAGRRRGGTAAMTSLGTVTTSPTGAFRFAVRPSFPMEYAVRYAGSETVTEVAASRSLAVSPRLTVSWSGRTVSVVVSPASGGGRARLQQLRSTGWVSVAGADLSATGRATLRATAGGTYRVVVARDGWAPATSGRMRLS